VTLIGGRLGDLKTRAERAIQAFEAGRAQLFRADGETKTYRDEDHEERLGALYRERNQVLAEVEQEARAQGEAATREITHLENRDPQELLTSEELERAGARRGFANDQADALDLGALNRRLESVLAGGDKAAIFAHFLAAQRRRQRILESRRESAMSAAGGSPVTAAQIPTATELDDVLERMHETLDAGRTAAAIEAARERIGHASDVQQIAYLALHDQSSVYNPRYAVTGR
jgi:hypothetical protein